MFERLLPGYWWTDPNESIGGLPYQAFAILLGLVFVAAIAVWILAPRLAPAHRLHQRLIARAARWAVGLSATGLILLLFRWQLVPFLSKRLWLILWFLTILGVIAYNVRYWRRQYPRDLADWNDAERRRRYLPRAGQGASRSRRRPRRHR
jgi:hypothetical protein